MAKRGMAAYLGTLLLLSTGAVSAATPSQLYGKSIILSWTENRVQRAVGAQNFHAVSAQCTDSIYVSSAGRAFSRVVFAVGRNSGSREMVGAGGTSTTGGARAVQIDGHSLAITTVLNGGARRIQIDFDAGYSSCSGNVIVGKAAGRGSLVGKSIINGKEIEMQSVSVSGVSCSIRDGNVFAQ